MIIPIIIYRLIEEIIIEAFEKTTQKSICYNSIKDQAMMNCIAKIDMIKEAKKCQIDSC